MSFEVATFEFLTNVRQSRGGCGLCRLWSLDLLLGMEMKIYKDLDLGPFLAVVWILKIWITVHENNYFIL